jgi:hypothetical protein
MFQLPVTTPAPAGAGAPVHFFQVLREGGDHEQTQRG